VKRSYVPIHPIINDFSNVRDYVGGTLPVFTESGDYDAACSCQIGKLRMAEWHLPAYDSLPGTSKSDTKHSIMMAMLKLRHRKVYDAKRKVPEGP
jgi:hypothetical protein